MRHASVNRVGIIGGGELGQALGRAFYRKGVAVEFFDKQDDRSTVATIDALVRTHEVIFLCVPSWANDEAARAIVKHAGEKTKTVISFSKGVEEGLVTMDKVLGRHLQERHVFGLAYGPTVAEELAVGRQAAAVLGLSDMDWYDPLSELFLKAKIYCEPSSDIQGLALCGALKNVYAIAFGMCDGLHLGVSAKGHLAVLVLREMKQLLIQLEADPLLAEGIAGLGDLITTGITEASFNYRIGKTIAEGIADEGIKSEGLHTLKQLSRHIDITHYSLLDVLDRMIYRYESTVELDDLLFRQA